MIVGGIDISEYLKEFLAPALSGIILTFVIFWFKLPSLMKDNTNAINRLTEKVADLFSEIKSAHERIDEGVKRHEVTQRILSDIIEYPVDTEKISEDYGKYPPRGAFFKSRRGQSEQ